MEQLLNSQDVGALIEAMSKETLTTILSSENLSTIGTKKQLKDRLRDFINDRRDAASRDTTIFEESLEKEQIDRSNNQKSDQVQEGQSTQRLTFPSVPANIVTESFDVAMQNIFSQSEQIRPTIDSALPLSRSTVQLTTASLPDHTYATSSNINAMPSAYNTNILNSIPQSQIAQPVPQSITTLSSTLNTYTTRTPIMSSTLNASANLFQPGLPNHNLQTISQLNRSHQPHFSNKM